MRAKNFGRRNLARLDCLRQRQGVPFKHVHGVYRGAASSSSGEANSVTSLALPGESQKRRHHRIAMLPMDRKIQQIRGASRYFETSSVSVRMIASMSHRPRAINQGVQADLTKTSTGVGAKPDDGLLSCG